MHKGGQERLHAHFPAQEKQTRVYSVNDKASFQVTENDNIRYFEIQPASRGNFWKPTFCHTAASKRYPTASFPAGGFQGRLPQCIWVSDKPWIMMRTCAKCVSGVVFRTRTSHEILGLHLR